jgi:hypothetical protein
MLKRTREGLLFHECGKFVPSSCGYGMALESCIYWDKERGWWVAGNGEYGSRVFFCPWCGVEMRTMKEEK